MHPYVRRQRKWSFTVTSSTAGGAAGKSSKHIARPAIRTSSSSMHSEGCTKIKDAENSQIQFLYFHRINQISLPLIFSCSSCRCVATWRLAAPRKNHTDLRNNEKRNILREEQALQVCTGSCRSNHLPFFLLFDGWFQVLAEFKGVR